MNYLTINTVSEIICFLVAVVCLLKDKDSLWRSMILFLMITVVTELLGAYIKHLYKADPTHVLPNSWVYNVFRLFEAGFTSLMFAGLFKKYINSKPLILSGLAVLGIIYAYETATHGIFKKHNIMATAMSVIFVIYCLYYFYLLLKDETYHHLGFSAPFWWVAGVLFFYFGDTAINITFSDLSIFKVTPEYYSISDIYKVLNVLQYGCWSYSFICKRWLTPISEASS